MTCDLEDLVAAITDALIARGRAVQPFRSDLECELVREAAALAARLLGRPTRTVERPDGFHVTMPGWTNAPASAGLGSALARQALDIASGVPHLTGRTPL
jgi:hypothetical protein